MAWKLSKVPSNLTGIKFKQVCFGPRNTFVAISDYKIIYSQDGGMSWIEGFSVSYEKFTYISSNGNFFLVITTKNVIYSSDGITWQKIILPIEWGQNWTCALLTDSRYILFKTGGIAISQNIDSDWKNISHGGDNTSIIWKQAVYNSSTKKICVVSNEYIKICDNEGNARLYSKLPGIQNVMYNRSTSKFVVSRSFGQKNLTEFSDSLKPFIDIDPLIRTGYNNQFEKAEIKLIKSFNYDSYISIAKNAKGNPRNFVAISTSEMIDNVKNKILEQWNETISDAILDTNLIDITSNDNSVFVLLGENNIFYTKGKPTRKVFTKPTTNPSSSKRPPPKKPTFLRIGFDPEFSNYLPESYDDNCRNEENRSSMLLYMLLFVMLFLLLVVLMFQNSRKN